MSWGWLVALISGGIMVSQDYDRKKKADEYLRNRPRPEPVKPIWGEPHRDPTSGKIVIENSRLYHEDVNKFGAYQAQQWVKHGKYNLTPEELKKEKARLKAKYERLYKR